MPNEFENMNQAQKILNAAFKCISARGYANVSLRDIAYEAGVVLSQLNYYYQNKEGLFIEIVKTLSQKYLHEIESNLKKGTSKKERISFLIKYFQEMLRQNAELFKILFDLTSMAIWSATLKELVNDLFHNLTELIEKYIVSEFSDKEEYQHHSTATLSRMMLGTLFGISIQVILADGNEDMINSLSTLKILFE